MDSLDTTEPLADSTEMVVGEAEVTTTQRLLSLLQLPLIALGSGGLLWLLLTQLPAWFGEMPYVGVSLQLTLMLYIGIIIWIFVQPFSPRVRTNSLLISLGLFFLAILTLKLKNTPFTVGGINGDARFYTTYVTKLASYLGYGDMFYKDLPSFYPPLYYFLVGRVADWFGIEPFRVMKYGLFVTVMALPLVTGALWRRLVDERMVAAVAFCMLVFPDWFKPNEWLALAMFVPWWLHWVDNITNYQPQTERERLWWWWGGGLIGAFIFQLYFFWLFVGGVTLLVRIGWWIVARRNDEQLWNSITNALLMLTVTALLSSLFWAPYLYSMFQTGGWEPLQNRWFSESKIPLPLYFLNNEWQALVYLGGLGYLVFGASGDRVARGLLWLVGGFFVWVAIGYLGILAHMPLLTFRSYPVLLYLLSAGAFLGLFRLWHGEFVLRELVEAILPWQRVATFIVIFVILLFANSVIVELQTQENVQDAVGATYPAEELAIFDRLTGGEYDNRVGLVTDRYRSILFFRPLYSFLAWSAHFSHPAGQFHERVDFLTKLSQLHDPAILATALRFNRYDSIDYWLLRQQGQFLHYQFVDDNFPNRVNDRELYFPRELFVEPFFTEQAEADYTLFQTSPADPPIVASIRERNEFSLVEAAQVYTMLLIFQDHLSVGDTFVPEWSESRLFNENISVLPTNTLLDLRQVATGRLRHKVDIALADQLALAVPVTLADQSGTPRIQLLGYEFDPAADAPDGVPLDLYFEPLDDLQENYTIWLHAFGPNGEKLVIEHQPSLSIMDWMPGRIYRERITLALPPARYQLDLELWEPTVDRRLLIDGSPGITLGQFDLADE